MNHSPFSLSRAWIGSLLVLLVFWSWNHLYLIGWFLHFRTLLCGLFPFVTFFPLAWFTVEFFSPTQKTNPDIRFAYAFFLALVFASGFGFLALTLRIGYPFLFLVTGIVSLLVFRRWWWMEAPGLFRTGFAFFLDEGFSIERGLLWGALVLAVIAALLPPLGYDAHEYHLACPEQYLKQGGWIAFPHNVYAGFPMNVEMLYLWPISMQSAAGCTVINLLLAISAMLALIPFASRWGLGNRLFLAPLFFLSTGFVLKLVLQANIDLGLAAASAILLLGYEESREERAVLPLGMMAIALGYALGAKYIAIVSVLFPFLVMASFDGLGNRKSERVSRLVLVLIGAGLVFLPWLIRNYFLYQNPFYPLLADRLGGIPDFFTPLFSAAHSAPVQSGGETIRAFLWLPLQKSIIDSIPAGFSCLWLAGFFFVLLLRRDHPAFRAATFVLTAYVAWFFLTQRNDRFLASTLPWMALISALPFAFHPSEGAKRVLHFLVFSVVAFQLWFAAGLILTKESVEYITAPIMERDYLVEQLPHFRAIEWLNREMEKSTEHSQHVGQVLFIGEAQTYGANFPVIAPTVFNHHPVQQGMPEGITHVVVNRFELARLAKGYGELGWPLGNFLETWIDQQAKSTLQQVFDAYPDQPGFIVVYRVIR